MNPRTDSASGRTSALIRGVTAAPSIMPASLAPAR